MSLWTRLIPWKMMVSRLAKARGFADPFAVMARLQRFAQPSEVSEPIELLRAGVAFHARGLLNARAIQHNLDWVWPYWVERQFDPDDPAFVPRAFSITHVNLTHRNWTAVGLPDLDWLPLVDPRGLVTPLLDGWSLDAWLIGADGLPLLPSRAREARQRLLTHEVAVETRVTGSAGELRGVVDVVRTANGPCCRLQLTARPARAGQLVLAIRPANPEGVSLVHDIRYTDGTTLIIDGEAEVRLSRPPARVCMSEYHRGDVLLHLSAAEAVEQIHCNVGLATAAAVYPLTAEKETDLVVQVPMPRRAKPSLSAVIRSGPDNCATLDWTAALSGVCTLRVPDERYQFLFDAAVRALILHSPGDVYPGPFTYRRFWFRDAAFILDALLALGLTDRVARVLGHYPARQDVRGYFRSQDGEWDSNGAALWTLDRYRRATGQTLPTEWLRAVRRGAEWIVHKRLPDTLPDLHAGLMPAGFSAEHLGLNDFYFWDDFWSAAGLQAAAALHQDHDQFLAERWDSEAARLLTAVDRAVARSQAVRTRAAIPASPHRRMDAGAIGSVAAGYPLQLWQPRDPRLLGTLEYLLTACMHHGGFFQDMIHSGVNAYLTLHLAQVLLRAGDPRHEELTRVVADLASPTGQWPEAIHPHTLGGCMGDGQHTWAAAEWVLMQRNAFVREEGDRLVVGAGLRGDWLVPGATLQLGPTPTGYGTVNVEVDIEENTAEVRWQAAWRGQPPGVQVSLPGFGERTVEGTGGPVRLARVPAEPEEVMP